jgi:hypothetical protein
MLSNWDYEDETANTSTQQLNRQKSARNLEILQFDPLESCAVFFDLKRGTIHTAYLTYCDCSDFNLVGNSPRKTFKPCMHIYRLAIELGICKRRYLPGTGFWRDTAQLANDHELSVEEAQFRAQSSRFALAGALAGQETKRLQGLPPDFTAWGEWAAELHNSGMQRVRQYRAYLIHNEKPNVIQVLPNGWNIHNHRVSLSTCDCGDFCARRLPCKHIYTAALASGIEIPFTSSEYIRARDDWKHVPLFLGARAFTFADYEAARGPGGPTFLDAGDHCALINP